MDVRTNGRVELAICASVGLVGGLVALGLDRATWLSGPLCGCIAGVAFARLAGARARSPGSGLILGLACALLAWLAIPAGIMAGGASASICDFNAGRAHFAELVTYVVCFGIPLGVTLGVLGARARINDRHNRHSLARAILVGGLAGFVGGWVFTHSGAEHEFSPLVHGLMPGSAPLVQSLLHALASALIGATFGVLFQREVRGVGSCMGFGLAYGMLWWFVGPLTLLPLFEGQPLNWTVELAAPQFGLLVGHVFFGLVLGLVYAIVDRAWIAFFYETDPLHRELEGTGTRLAFALTAGGVAGFAGGLVFAWPMYDRGMLPYVAEIVGGTSEAIGIVVHLAISVFIGMIYGALFAREAPHVGLAVGWGLVYGLVWWFLGQLTLFEKLIGLPYEWSIENAAAALPSLIGHLMYGATTAFVFIVLERRRAATRWFETAPTSGSAEELLAHTTPAPALSVFVLGLGMLLPILLG